MAEKNYFVELNELNVSDKTEKKNGLTYLSWAWAWGELKKRHPDSTYTIYEDPNGRPYHTDGRTCWVKTGVTVNGIEHIEYLPVMDFKNQSIPLDKITSVAVNKTIQRSLTKAVARHGLGLYIYAGEDLPEGEASEAAEDPTQIPSSPITKGQIAQIMAEMKRTGITAKSLCKQLGINDIAEITEARFPSIMDAFGRTPDKAA